MIKKLRIRFISIAMLAVAIVLTIIIGGINIANYVSVCSSMNAKLELIAANGGVFPDLTSVELERTSGWFKIRRSSGSADSTETTEDTEGTEALESTGNMTGSGTGGAYGYTGTNRIGMAMSPDRVIIMPDQTGTDAEDDTETIIGFFTKNEYYLNNNGSWEETELVIPDGMNGKLSSWGISEESQYATRYFTVTMDTDGTDARAKTGQIAAVSSAEADEYALSLYQQGVTSGTGFIDGYKYLACQQKSSSGRTYLMYVFLDGSTEMRNVKAFLVTSVGISLGGLLIVFLLVLFFSKLAVKPMAESYEKQKRFITDASHEIKTPLTIIDANTEVLEMMEGENEWTEGIRKQIKRLTTLTNKLVFLSRMDEEGTKLEMTDFPISDVVLDVAEGFEAVADTKGKKLSLDIQPDLNYNGDEKNIRQLVSLLLDNAMKYSSDHGEIQLKLVRSGKNLVMTVWNTVDEIAPGSQDVLFDRFYRAESSHNTKTGGFGIGLSVAQAIVLAHKGKISAKSDDGKSIIFTITL